MRTENTMKTTTTSLQERIQEAISQNSKRREEDAQRQFAEGREMLAGQIRKVLAIDSDLEFTHNEYGRVETMIEGLRFTARYDDYDLKLYVVLECKHCHETEDRYATSLETLAYSVEHGLSWPHKDGECLKQQEREQTKRQPTEDRLLEALRDYISEHSYQG